MNTDALTTLPTTAWRKSSYSTSTGNCVEVAPAAHGIVIRHSKHPTAGTITFPYPTWPAFVREACNDLISANGVAALAEIGTDTLVSGLHTAVELRFNKEEWSAFTAGAADGEFDFIRPVRLSKGVGL